LQAKSRVDIYEGHSRKQVDSIFFIFSRVLFFSWFLTASQNPFFFWGLTYANILGSDNVNVWGSDPGLGFFRTRKMVITTGQSALKKWGWFFPECGVWFDPCSWFCRGPPPPFFNFVSKQISAVNPTTLGVVTCWCSVSCTRDLQRWSPRRTIPKTIPKRYTNLPKPLWMTNWSQNRWWTLVVCRRDGITFKFGMLLAG